MPESPARSGAIFALLAYVSWGTVPIYWRAIRSIPSLEVLAHRVAWSMLFLIGLILVLRLGPEVRAVLGSWRRVRYLIVSAALVTMNWGLFIWSVQSNHLLEASLGYFINPLVSVALGVLVLRESLRPAQRLSLVIASVGVIVLVIWLRQLPWIALGIATSFGLYGLVRKVAPVASTVGLTVETLFVTPIALAYLVVQTAAGKSAFVTTPPSFVALLALSGPITALPLVWFSIGARRLPLSTLGFYQYVAPTLQFLLAVLVFHEPLRGVQFAAFVAIWSALAIYTWDAVRTTARR